MRLLFDQGTPVPLRRALLLHEVEAAFERGWGTLQNGELLRVAEAAGFDPIITTDQNLPYQQNLTTRLLANLVLLTTDWLLIRLHPDPVAQATDKLVPGFYVELAFPP